MKLLRKFLRDEEGLEMVEWAIVATVVIAGGGFAMLSIATDAGNVLVQLQILLLSL